MLLYGNRINVGYGRTVLNFADAGAGSGGVN